METPKRRLLQKIERQKKAIKQLKVTSDNSGSDASVSDEEAFNTQSPNNSNNLVLLVYNKRLQTTPLRCISDNYDDQDSNEKLPQVSPFSPSCSSGAYRSPNGSIEETLKHIQTQIKINRSERKKRRKAISSQVINNRLLISENGNDDVHLDETLSKVNTLKHQLELITNTNHCVKSPTKKCESIISVSPAVLKSLHAECQIQQLFDTPVLLNENFKENLKNVGSDIHCNMLDDSTNDDLLLECIEAAESQSITDFNAPHKPNPSFKGIIEANYLMNDDDDYFLSVDV